MKEYIERAAVKDEILSWAVCINHPELLSKKDTMHCIDSLPAADVAEVRHGRWIAVFGESSGLNWKCSLCAKRVLQKSPYCPNCGARMEKEAEHEVSE